MSIHDHSIIADISTVVFCWDESGSAATVVDLQRWECFESDRFSAGSSVAIGSKMRASARYHFLR